MTEVTEVSPIRIYALRLFYLASFIGGLLKYWPLLLNPATPLGPYDGAAFSYWVTLMTLMGVGLRYPLQMVPFIFLQLSYKTVWMLAVALPLRVGGHWDANMARITKLFAVVMVVDALVIPWSYLLTNYLKKPGTGWSLERRRVIQGDGRATNT